MVLPFPGSPLTPHHPGNDFYALCAGTEPLCMIFLPEFDHPVTREYLTRYLKTLPRLRGVRLACVVRSAPAQWRRLHRGKSFRSHHLRCAGCAVQLSGGGAGTRTFELELFCPTHLQKCPGCRLSLRPQCSADLPMTLIVGHEGKILFTHSGRSQTDLPEDCVAIRELAREVVHTKAADQRRASHHCSDETLTLPDLIGWDDVDNDQ